MDMSLIRCEVPTLNVPTVIVPILEVLRILSLKKNSLKFLKLKVPKLKIRMFQSTYLYATVANVAKEMWWMHAEVFIRFFLD